MEISKQFIGIFFTQESRHIIRVLFIRVIFRYSIWSETNYKQSVSLCFATSCVSSIWHSYFYFWMKFRFTYSSSYINLTQLKTTSYYSSPSYPSIIIILEGTEPIWNRFKGQFACLSFDSRYTNKHVCFVVPIILTDCK